MINTSLSHVESLVYSQSAGLLTQGFCRPWTLPGNLISSGWILCISDKKDAGLISPYSGGTAQDLHLLPY